MQREHRQLPRRILGKTSPLNYLAAGLLLLLSALGGRLAKAELPAVNGLGAVKVIDVHTHIFNARDLPLTGTLEALGAPHSVAVIIRKSVVAATPSDEVEGLSGAALDSAIEHPNLDLGTAENRIEIQRFLTSKGNLPIQSNELGISNDTKLIASVFQTLGIPSWRQCEYQSSDQPEE